MMRFLFAALFLAISICLISCEKEIEVNLKDSEAQYVIEGEINDSDGPYEVRITSSKNFNMDNNFAGLSGAVVTLVDVTVNRSEKLNEIKAGVFHTSLIKGVPGHKYELKILIDKHVFSATSVMPNIKVNLDSIYTRTYDFGNENLFVVPVYKDPAGTGNYYRLRQYVNNQFLPGSIARSDKATDGMNMLLPLIYRVDNGNGRPQIKPGDKLMVELQSVDEGVYDCYRTIVNATSDGSGNPANPLTNFKGGAMGVFNACTTSSLEAIAN